MQMLPKIKFLRGHGMWPWEAAGASGKGAVERVWQEPGASGVSGDTPGQRGAAASRPCGLCARQNGTPLLPGRSNPLASMWAW